MIAFTTFYRMLEIKWTLICRFIHGNSTRHFCQSFTHLRPGFHKGYFNVPWGLLEFLIGFLAGLFVVVLDCELELNTNAKCISYCHLGICWEFDSFPGTPWIISVLKVWYQRKGTHSYGQPSLSRHSWFTPGIHLHQTNLLVHTVFQS